MINELLAINFKPIPSYRNVFRYTELNRKKLRWSVLAAIRLGLESRKDIAGFLHNNGRVPSYEGREMSLPTLNAFIDKIRVEKDIRRGDKSRRICDMYRKTGNLALIIEHTGRTRNHIRKVLRAADLI